MLNFLQGSKSVFTRIQALVWRTGIKKLSSGAAIAVMCSESALANPGDFFPLASTIGPLAAVRSMDAGRFEYGGEVGFWGGFTKTSLMTLGLDAGGSNHALWIEAQVAVKIRNTGPVFGVSPGVAWQHHEGLLPQATVWFWLVGGGRLSFPFCLVRVFLPFVRVTGISDDVRVWEGGLMVKLPLAVREQ